MHNKTFLLNENAPQLIWGKLEFKKDPEGRKKYTEEIRHYTLKPKIRHWQPLIRLNPKSVRFVYPGTQSPTQIWNKFMEL